MTHLKIELNNGIIEEVSSAVIDKLYDIVHSGTLDNTSNLIGRLHTSATYQDYIDYLEDTFKVNGVKLLIIDATKKYIRFADPAVLSVLVSRFGDGTGVTISNLSSVSLLPAGIFDYNTTIETFNELGLFTNITSMSYDCFRGCTNLRSIDLSNILEFSSGNALNRCSKLGSDNNGILNLPKLNSILGGSCLASCTSLVEVNIGSNVSSGNKISLIKNSTFSDCTNLEKVTGLSEVTSLEGGVFYSCQKLKNLPDLNNSTVLSIGDECFFNCFALKCIDLTSLTISFVGKNHFYRCRNLIDLSTNDYTQASSAAATYTFNWSTVPRGIFWQAAITNKSFNFPNATSIGEHAFDSSGIVGITSPNVISIDSNAFSNCTSLTTIDLSNVTTIGSYAFDGCSALTSVGDLSNVTSSIGNSAFRNCSALTSVDLSSCMSIGWSTFEGCSELTNLTINNIKTYNLLTGYIDIVNTSILSIVHRAFCNCNKLGSSQITVEQNTGYLNLIFNNCTSLGESVFSNSGFVSLSFPNVTSLGRYLFSDCALIQHVDLPKATGIPQECFANCTNLKSFNISNTVTSIGLWAFKGSGLQGEVIIPDSVTQIGGDAFQNCPEITCFIMQGTVPPSLNSSSTLTNKSNPTAPIYVPTDYLLDYHDAWDGLNNVWNNLTSRILPMSNYNP